MTTAVPPSSAAGPVGRSGSAAEAASASDVAVIGLACRLPGAADADQFWRNLESGTESITHLTQRQLDAAGVEPTLSRRSTYVSAVPELEDGDKFDASFFGYSPREARLMDPQHRVFLETAWHALESAGYDPERYDGDIGIYAGSAMNTYLLSQDPAHRLQQEYLLSVVANDKDFLTSRTSYHLNLTGPSVTVQTACSTSLVAVHLACQSLLHGECDLALAGGVSVRVPQHAGYLHEPGGILSPDGHCRAFDAQAQGTLFGSGVGVVVLKLLTEALADGDHVRAVVKGSAVNNDGSHKVGFTAPSVSMQAEVVVEALAHADVPADTIGYVEAHGSATPLGDPIEVAALARAFRGSGPRRGSCAIGSVKTNVGHLDAAAGVTGLIKTVLALEHGTIPPSLHFRQANPAIDFAATPFFVNTAALSWPRRDGPRRACVNSLGIGGTNAHVVLEQAPVPAGRPPPRPAQLVVLSAKTPAALEAATARLAQALDPAVPVADVAHTLQLGRRAFGHRRAVVCTDSPDAAAALQRCSPVRVRTGRVGARPPSLAFLFPGGGSPYPGMGVRLHLHEPAFREVLEEGFEALGDGPGRELRQLMLGGSDPDGEFRRPSRQLPALFLTEVALFHLWRSWGVRPAAMSGPRRGEVTAGHLAQVFGFDDALRIVVARGELLEDAADGVMLSVGLAEADVVPLLGAELDLAAVNAPGTCIVSGPGSAVGALADLLRGRGVAVSVVKIATAAHSRLLEASLPRFAARLAQVRLAVPTTPFISNVTGTWITTAQATDPSYWVRQVRSTVRFADGLRELLREPHRQFLEVGPGETLSTFLRLQPEVSEEQVATSLRPSTPLRTEDASVLDALGQLWSVGVDVDWDGLAATQQRRRVPLPGYPFERQTHWLDAEPPRVEAAAPRRTAGWAGRIGPLRRTLAGGAARLRLWSRGAGDAPTTDSASRPAPGGASAAPVRTGDPSATEADEVVRTALQEALGVEQLGSHDDFFELGGTSLLALQAVATINRTLGLEMTALMLLESPTVAGLAERVAAVRRSARTAG